jgi:hypothetical protein
VDRDPLSLAGLALGLLVTAPFRVLPHAGEASTTYRAERIEHEPRLDGAIDAPEDVARLDCDRDALSRSCLLARHVVDDGPVRVDVTHALPVDVTHALPVDVTHALPVVEGAFAGPRYVAVHASPSCYERTVTLVGGAGGPDRVAVEYALEPVTPEAILENVSVAARELPRPIRGLHDGGTATVHGRTLDVAGTVVRADGDCHLVRVVDRDDPEYGRTRSSPGASRS